MSLSSQMVRSPRAFNAALYAFQFVVRYLSRPQLVSLISLAYRSSGLDLCNNAVEVDAVGEGATSAAIAASA